MCFFVSQTNCVSNQIFDLYLFDCFLWLLLFVIWHFFFAFCLLLNELHAITVIMHRWCDTTLFSLFIVDYSLSVCVRDKHKGKVSNSYRLATRTKMAVVLRGDICFNISACLYYWQCVNNNYCCWCFCCCYFGLVGVVNITFVAIYEA